MDRDPFKDLNQLEPTYQAFDESFYCGYEIKCAILFIKTLIKNTPFRPLKNCKLMSNQIRWIRKT